jgi:hypothetical protein
MCHRLSWGMSAVWGLGQSSLTSCHPPTLRLGGTYGTSSTPMSLYGWCASGNTLSLSNRRCLSTLAGSMPETACVGAVGLHDITSSIKPCCACDVSTPRHDTLRRCGKGAGGIRPENAPCEGLTLGRGPIDPMPLALSGHQDSLWARNRQAGSDGHQGTKNILMPRAVRG